MADDDVLASYLDDMGRITRWPTRKKKKDQIAILEYLATKIKAGEIYTERQINDLLKQHHTFEDWALLRRELFERGYLNREKDGSQYWATPNTSWTKDDNADH
jgi:hypothetical protein